MVHANSLQISMWITPILKPLIPIPLSKLSTLAK